MSEGYALAVANAALAQRKGSPELNERVDTQFITQVLVAPFFLRLLITGEEPDTRLPERVGDLVLSGPVVQAVG